MSKTIQIRDVDDDVYRALARRAAEEGISVSELLRREARKLVERLKASGPECTLEHGFPVVQRSESSGTPTTVGEHAPGWTGGRSWEGGGRHWSNPIGVQPRFGVRGSGESVPTHFTRGRGVIYPRGGPLESDIHHSPGQLASRDRHRLGYRAGHRF
jgi:hypothetical protein